MIKLEFNFDELNKYAQSIGAAADQVPYAIALALNEANDVTRRFLIQATWPMHVTERNKSFISASLTSKGARATKGSAAVELYDRLDRGNLQMQSKGGTRTPKGGSHLAIPDRSVPRTSRGVPARLRPKAMANSFRRGDAIYQKQKNGKLRLMYVLKATAKLPKRVPFYEDYAVSMQRELTRLIPKAVAKAMATRRR